MVIVSGHLYVKPGKRKLFLDSSYPAIVQARSTNGCLDFVVAADPVEEDRVNVYEEWETEADLRSFRGTGPDDDLSDLIVDAKITERVI